MITLCGHGYIGQAIADELRRQAITFCWVRHTDRWNPTGPVINAAGYTGSPNVDACQDKPIETMEGNLYWPLQVEKLTTHPVIHLSSGCIYDGHKDGGWTEEDEPNFTGSLYSLSKRMGQQALTPYFNKSYLLRLRMPFGTRNHPKNLLTKLSNYPKLIDGENSMSRVEDVARTAVFFAKELPPPGIYNLVNPGAIRTRTIVEMMGMTKQWFTPEEFKQVVKVPRSFCNLSSDKLQRVFPLDDVETALKDCIVTETLAEPAAA